MAPGSAKMLYIEEMVRTDQANYQPIFLGKYIAWTNLGN